MRMPTFEDMDRADDDGCRQYHNRKESEMHQYKKQRYAGCDIIWNGHEWEAFYFGYDREATGQFVCSAPGISPMIKELKRMKLAKEGPWS